MGIIQGLCFAVKVWGGVVSCLCPKVDFGFEGEAELLVDAGLGHANEVIDILGGGAAEIDDEIAVFGGNLGVADDMAFETDLFYQPASGLLGRGIFESAAGGG